MAKWVYSLAQNRNDAEFQLIDIKEYDLPLLDEPVSPVLNQYTKHHTKVWSDIISSFDAYVFVTPEYNHSIPGALKNTIDFLYKEWNNKSAGFVGYGTLGASRAIEHLRLVMAELQVADVKEQVSISIFTDFENFSVFKPAPIHEQYVNQMLDHVVEWGKALQLLRNNREEFFGSAPVLER